MYQPLDYISSMDLGINTGWCTTGRYGHYGHPEYTPSANDAKKHFEEYTSSGIGLYYFLNPSTFYGEYAIALYPNMLYPDNLTLFDKTRGKVIHIVATNCELFNAQDDNIWYNQEIMDITNNELKLNLQIEIRDAYVKVNEDGLEIEDGTILKCWDEGIRKVEIPNNVKEIGRGVFYFCTSLQSITIPNSVTNIGEGAFHYCSSLTSITIPNSVTIIADYAFDGCTSLQSITIPNSVKEIGEYVFLGCESLKSITITNSVTYIDGNAFYNCTQLTIKCEENSYAHEYAQKHDIKFELI